MALEEKRMATLLQRVLTMFDVVLSSVLFKNFAEEKTIWRTNFYRKEEDERERDENKVCQNGNVLTIERMNDDALVLWHGGELCARIIESNTPYLIRVLGRCINASSGFCIPDSHWFIRWAKSQIKCSLLIDRSNKRRTTYEEIKCWLSALNATLSTQELWPDNVLMVVGEAECLRERRKMIRVTLEDDPHTRHVVECGNHRTLKRALEKREKSTEHEWAWRDLNIDGRIAKELNNSEPSSVCNNFRVATSKIFTKPFCEPQASNFPSGL